MRKLKMTALTGLSVLALVALTVAGAAACDGDAKGASTKTASASCSKTADAQKADAKVAGADCSAACAAACEASAKGASAKNAGSDCSSAAKAATAQNAGAGCATGAKNAELASGGCATQGATAKAIKVETVRMPSGALAVFYHGKNAEMVKTLQAGAEMGAAKFGCPMAAQVASSENCKTEMVATSTGAMMLVTSSDASALDQYEEQYAVAVASTSESGSE